jgi:hypothetical protein
MAKIQGKISAGQPKEERANIQEDIQSRVRELLLCQVEVLSNKKLNQVISKTQLLIS